MAESEPAANRPKTRWWQPRFGIGTLMLLTFLCCLLLAVAGNGLRVGAQPGSSANVLFVFLVTGAPFFAMMLMSAYRWIKWAIRQWRQ